MKSYDQSNAWRLHAARVTPGAAQTLSKRPGNWPVGAYPACIARAHGAHFWDLDGHQYLDWSCGLGAVSLGYGDPDVTEAVMRTMAAGGPSLSLPHRLEASVGEQFLQAIDRPTDQIRWVKTGSEATEAAIRVARSATGRDLILTVAGGYHSWHSWFAATKDVAPGVPPEYHEMVQTFAYNDLAELETIVKLFRHDTHAIDGSPRGIAAVIMEPVSFTPHAPGFLAGVRALCDRYGILLIFDEVFSGFRWFKGGAGQSFFRVQPDLMTFGKSIANGYPLGCLVGAPDLMAHASVISGTFGGDTLALAACGAVLDRYREQDPTPHNWAIGDSLASGVKTLLSVTDLPARLEGYGIHPRLVWTPEDALLRRRLMSVWLQELAQQGIHVHPQGWNVMAAHTQDDVHDSLDAAAHAFKACQVAWQTGDWSVLRGATIEENPFRRKE